MLSRVLCLLSLGLGCVVFLSGAWPGSFARSPETDSVAFVTQPIALDASVIGESATAAELVARALEQLDPAKMKWMTTKIRQTMVTAISRFTAEGMLHRGPHHCARLEMTVSTGNQSNRVLVVSDGRLVAQIVNTPESSGNAEVRTLPEADIDKANSLDQLGCDGPAALLRKVRPYLKNATLTTGLLGDEPVIRIRATIPATDADAPGRARYCQLFLDAKSLWPCRAEWWAEGRNQGHAICLSVDFLEPAINQTLDVETCERLFSYHPAEANIATEP